ncbi:SDR family NAD(P)-dependent oxidoreductase [Pseudoalteromonas ardens]|uniref:SDR family NAD(P)-dependent oxidoreductase n=1 Tax=Pseudoalteromonas ardens TaxID=3048490 RepID=UPI0024C379AE|nr:type I polyketide synthase [Pseudoalteromonas sp. R96]MDK1314045.1 SDR family NAD(P)-dependent oxidoreductase [Pseudoalteromonas sp. R96]
MSTYNNNNNLEDAIAIVGMSCRFPGADTVDQFWHNLVNSVESINTLSPEELKQKGVSQETLDKPNFVRACAEPAQPDAFDAGFFGISPEEAKIMDPQQRLFLECAWQAIDSANISIDNYRERFGVFGGVSLPYYMIYHLPHLQPNYFNPLDGKFSQNMFIGLGNDKSYACSRVSHKLNLTGPSVNVDAACATSLFAVHLACKSLLEFECDAAVAGGAKVLAPTGLGYLYEEGGTTSPDGKIYSFDARANGTVFSSGAGAITLKRLETALADGDEIHAVIRGTAISNDGADKMAFTAPSFSGQRQAIIDAHTFADIEADSISYVEAHGTGTPMGDPIEISALTAAFAQSTERTGYCALGTLKPNVGHMEAAAGVAGIIKTVMALKHKQIPATLNFEQPNPAIDFANSPFYVCDQLTSWPSSDTPRRAAVSSFGMGGQNAHAVLEEFVDSRVSEPSDNTQLLLLSAKSEGSVEQGCVNLGDYLNDNAQIELADAAFTLAKGRCQLPRRRAIVAKNRAHALSLLSNPDSSEVLSGAVKGDAAKVSFMFPGQGSQHLAMAHALYQKETVFRDAFNQCAALFKPQLGLDLASIIYTSDAQDLRINETRYTQPALFAVEYALAQQWLHWGVKPDAMIGHSIGEYVCACVSGVLSLADAIRLIAARGRLMYSAEPGDMLSVALSAQDVTRYLIEGLDIAAVNAPELTVVSGPAEQIAAMSQRLAADQVSHQKLHTSHAFHSAMMAPILADFEAEFAGITLHAPSIPFISNITGDWITEQQATDPKYWVNHLRSAVLFSDGVAKLMAQQHLLLEVGPGQTLCQLARKHGEYKPAIIASQNRVQSSTCAQHDLYTAVGKLWLANGTVDWDAFYGAELRKKVRLPSYAFERTKFWLKAQNWNEQVPQYNEGRQAFKDWFYTPNWHRHSAVVSSPALYQQLHEGQHWLVFADQEALAQPVLLALQAAGIKITLVGAGEELSLVAGDMSTIDPAQASHYHHLIEWLADSDTPVSRVVHMWNLHSAVSEDVEQQNQLSFYSLIYLAQALQKLPHDIGLDLVSNGVHEVLGSETLTPLKASMIGPCKTIPLEYSALTCRHIDLAYGASPQDIRLLVEQLLTAQPADSDEMDTVAIRNGHYWTECYTETPLAEALPAELTPGGVYLITGGLGGIGLVFANYLAKTCQAKLVLTTRQTLPAQADWEAIVADPSQPQSLISKLKSLLALIAQGAEVLVVAADVNQREEVETVLAQTLDRFGQLNGMMHSAGIAGDGIIELKTKEVSDQVLKPKIQGTQNLLDVTRSYWQQHPADFIVLNSSAYAVTSGIGQVDYCAANNVMNKLALKARQQGLPVTSVCWGPWANVGMTAGRFTSTVEAQNVAWLDSYTPVSHPLLKGHRTLADGQLEYAIEVPVDHWLVEEHQVAGRPALPGTALLDLINTAAQMSLATTGAFTGVQLQDIHFLEPVWVEQTPKQLILTLTELSTGYEVSLFDNQDVAKKPLLLGRVLTCNAPQSLPTLATMQTQYAEQTLSFTGSPQSALPGKEAVVQFGRRWHSIQQVGMSEQGAVCEFALADDLSSDCNEYRLHPALLDLATGIVNIHWLKALQNDPQQQYLPAGYQNIQVYGDLPSHIYSVNRLNATSTEQLLSLDIDIYDAEGSLLVQVAGFRLARIEAQRFTESASDTVQASADDEFEGIQVEEGITAFERILMQPGLGQIVVSPQDLNLLLAQAGEAPTGPEDVQDKLERPDIDTEYQQPSNETEQQLTDVWSALLGLQRIGVNDDFFELGGDSLIATKLVSAIRSNLDVDVTLGQVFGKPTIAQLAEHIALSQWASAGNETNESETEREEGEL